MALSALVAIGCSSDNDNNGVVINGPELFDAQTIAMVAARTPEFDAGQIEILTADEAPATVAKLPATGSDILAKTDGTNMYENWLINSQSTVKKRGPTPPISYLLAPPKRT